MDWLTQLLGSLLGGASVPHPGLAGLPEQLAATGVEPPPDLGSTLPLNSLGDPIKGDRLPALGFQPPTDAVATNPASSAIVPPPPLGATPTAVPRTAAIPSPAVVPTPPIEPPAAPPPPDVGASLNEQDAADTARYAGSPETNPLLKPIGGSQTPNYGALASALRGAVAPTVPQPQRPIAHTAATPGAIKVNDILLALAAMNQPTAGTGQALPSTLGAALSRRG